MSDYRSVSRRGFLQSAIATSSVLVLPARAKAASTVAAGNGDWPTYRRDPALSAESPLRGGFAVAPSEAWSVDLGGPPVPAETILVRDVTGAGEEAFLILSASSVACRSARGKLLWSLDNFLSPVVQQVLDFAGDGTRGILLTTTRAGRVDTWMVHGTTGRATHLWRDENNFGGHTRVGELLPGVAGLQIACTSSGQTPPAPHGGDVRLLSFENGLDEPRFRIRQHVTGVFYSPLPLLADLNGDGRDELVIVSHEQIWAFDPEDGRQTFYQAYGPSIRTYMATIAAVKLAPADRHPVLLMINHSLPGLKAVATDGTSTAHELWKDVVGGVADQYQKRVTVNPAGTTLVYDLGRDENPIVLAAVKNEHDDGVTHLVVFDARTGRRLAELPEAEMLAADDLDGDGRPELLVRRGALFQVCRWESPELRVVWQQADVLPLVRPLPLEGDRRLFSSTSLVTKGNSALWRDDADTSLFLFRFPDGAHACRLTASGVERVRPVTRHEALGNVPEQRSSPLRVVWDGTRLTTLADGVEVYRYVPAAPPTYLAPPPLVADLHGERTILVRDVQSRWCCFAVNGERQQVLLERPYETPELVADATGVGPLVCDLDGDGYHEVIATIHNEQGRPACVVLDGEGREKRRFDLLPGMTAMNRGPTGSLGSGRGRWLLLRMSGENADHARQFVVAAYDGQTGTLLWTRTHYGKYGPNPVGLVAHFPSAVWDYDGDGADDWLVCSENFYGIIDVAHNRDLVGPVILSDALPNHWTAYTFPSLAALEPGRPPLVFHHSAYSLVLITDLEGTPVWHYGMTRDTAGRWGQFVDLDGDGRREIVHVQPDGKLRCFTFAAAARCPTCPADSPLTADQAHNPRWELDLGRPISRPVAADLDADGRFELVFGCDDGHLYAFGERDQQPRLLWSVDFGRRVGEPVMVDLDGAGRPAILVTTEDGKLHCLAGRVSG